MVFTSVHFKNKKKIAHLPLSFISYSWKLLMESTMSQLPIYLFDKNQ